MDMNPASLDGKNNVTERVQRPRNVQLRMTRCKPTQKFYF